MCKCGGQLVFKGPAMAPTHTECLGCGRTNYNITEYNQKMEFTIEIVNSSIAVDDVLH